MVSSQFTALIRTEKLPRARVHDPSAPFPLHLPLHTHLPSRSLTHSRSRCHGLTLSQDVRELPCWHLRVPAVLCLQDTGQGWYDCLVLSIVCCCFCSGFCFCYFFNYSYSSFRLHLLHIPACPYSIFPPIFTPYLRLSLLHIYAYLYSVMPRTCTSFLHPIFAPRRL